MWLQYWGVPGILDILYWAVPGIYTVYPNNAISIDIRFRTSVCVQKLFIKNIVDRCRSNINFPTLMHPLPSLPLVDVTMVLYIPKRWAYPRYHTQLCVFNPLLA